MTQPVKKQIVKYITKQSREGNVLRTRRIGVMVAEKDGDTLRFGYSVFNNNDLKAVRDKNIELRKVIAALKRTKKSGKADIPDAPKLLPEFDKAEALRVAKERLSETIVLDSVPEKIRRVYHTFARGVIAWAFADKYIQ